MLIILASSIYGYDPQIELLVENLKREFVDYVLINPFKHNDLRKLSIVCEKGINRIMFDGNILNITKVYIARHLRTDCIIDFPDGCGMTTLYRHKVDAFLTEICAVLKDCKWFPGEFTNLLNGDMKCYLYQLAHVSGLIVPEITANSFVKPDGLSYQKSLGAPFTITYDNESGDEIAVTLKNSTVIEDETDGLPWQWQTNIKSKYQIRCVVVGENIWAFSALSENFQGRSLREYQVENDVVWKKHVIPQHIEKSTINLMKKLNLEFSCPEFLIDLKGKYHFIDLNPCGDWYGFGSKDDNVRIAKAIAVKLRG